MGIKTIRKFVVVAFIVLMCAAVGSQLAYSADSVSEAKLSNHVTVENTLNNTTSQPGAAEKWGIGAPPLAVQTSEPDPWVKQNVLRPAFNIIWALADAAGVFFYRNRSRIPFWFVELSIQAGAVAIIGVAGHGLVSLLRDVWRDEL